MDDERPIEQLLKNYAQHKREAADMPPHLHEARRRQLHAEVARQYPAARPAGFIWPLWWPRFALALGVLMLGAALAVYVFTPAREPASVADTYASLGPAQESSLDKAANRNSTSASSLSVQSKTEDSRPTTTATGPAAAPRPGPSPLVVSSSPDTGWRSTPPTQPEARSTNALASPTGTFTAALPAGAIRNVQLFNNSATAPEFKNNALAAQVMASFKVEQAGNVIRIIDQDGSVYTGQLQPMRERTPTSRSAAVEASPSGNVSRSFAFQAIGLNRSLNEPVTFSGNLAVQPLNNPAPSGRKEKRPRVVTTATGDAGALVNSRISGKAQVGANELITVEAVAVDVRR